MNTVKVILALLFCTCLARADDYDLEGILPYLFFGEVMNSGVQCASYGTACTAQRPCCQYYGHGRMDCFNGQCLQAQCGYPGQQCGSFIGECCWHLNQVCNGGFFGGNCVDRTTGK